MTPPRASLGFLVVAFCAFLGSCVSEDGGGSDTTTLTGVVRDPGGSPAGGARVKLFPVDYDPAVDGPDSVRRVQTGSDGRFEFGRLDGDRLYNLVAGSDRNFWAFAESLASGGSERALTLDSARVFFVSVYDSAFAARNSGVAYFPGTDILAHCDTAGDVAIDSVPQGLRRLVMESPSGWMHDSILTEPQDTLFVKADPDEMTAGGTRIWMAQSGAAAQTLRSVWFPGFALGYAAGDGGVILKTVDGETWIQRPGGTSRTLYSICIRGNPNSGWAVGDSGTILRTRDGGATWQAQIGGTLAALRGIHRPTGVSDLGWIVGDSGNILRTVDAGQTWIRVSSGTGQSLRAVHFPDSTFGLAVGDGGLILRTADGGATWTPQASGTVRNLHSVRFLGFNTAYAVGDSGTVLKGSSGGTVWIPQASGTIERLNSVFFTDANSGYAAGGGGLMLQTFDGGARWIGRTVAGSAELFSVFFPTPSIGFTVGQAGAVFKASP